MNMLVQDIINLMVQINAILPEAKVYGTDMFGHKTDPSRKCLKDLLDEKITQLAKAEGANFEKVWDELLGEVEDKMQVIFDTEDDLHRNEEVDDVQFRYTQAEVTARGDGDMDDEQGWEYTGARNEIARIYGLADEMVLRNKRMATRLAIVCKLEGREETRPLLEKVSDSLVEDLMIAMSNKMITEELKPFVVSSKDILFQERVISKKDNASFFRRELEKKAEVLRTMSIICEEMMSGKRQMDEEYISSTRKLAEKLKATCQRYFDGGAHTRAFRRYSYAATCALFNECLDVLHVLGVYNQTFYRVNKGDGSVYSFFTKKTQEDMVEVKSGLHWAEELRSMVYEQDDGTGRTAVRGSGD